MFSINTTCNQNKSIIHIKPLYDSHNLKEKWFSLIIHYLFTLPTLQLDFPNLSGFLCTSLQKGDSTS